MRVLQLWALLPAYCVSPMDMVAALPTLTPALVNAVKSDRYPELQPTVCNSLKALVKIPVVVR